MNEQQNRSLFSGRVLKSLALALLIGLGLSALLFGSMSVAAQAQDLRTPGNPMPFPTPNSHTVPQTASVGIAYDEPIDPDTVDASTFAVHAMASGQLLGVYDVVNNVIYLTPTRPFYPGELVMASATTGTLSDIDGNGPLTPTVWTFRAEVTAGSGVFVDSGQRLGTNLLGRDVELGDLDGDADLDAFVVNRASRPAKVWLNGGNGIFVDSGQGLTTTNGSGLALGDIDGDGNLDAVVAGSNQSEIWKNDGLAGFASAQVISESTNLSFGDLDGDGDLDLFLARQSGNAVWLNDGGLQGGVQGTFSDSGQVLGNPALWWDVELADLDDDGDLDAFVANLGGANRVWLNDGSATFTDSGQSLGASFSASVAIGDLDEDGLPDVFVGNTSTQGNEIWFNLGGGVFTPTVQTLGSSSTHDVALGDVDGDGDLDAFWANIKNQPSELWLNSGGVFSDSGQSFGGTFESYGVALGDVNSDGDLDAFVTNEPASDYVWLNNLAPSLEDVALDESDYDEGETATVTGKISDPDPQDSFTLRISWGDGVTDTYNYPAGTAYFTETHTFLDDDPTGTPWDVYDVELVLFDGDGSSDSFETDATVYNVAPTFDSISLEAAVDENDTATLVATFNDPGLLDTYDAVIIWGDGNQDNLSYSAGVRTFMATHQYLDDDPVSGTPSDIMIVTVILVDDDTGEAIEFVNITVLNVEPTFDSISLEAAVDEDDTATLVAAFNDPGLLDTYDAVIIWGDGNQNNFSYSAGVRTFTATHQYLDDDPVTGTPSDILTVTVMLVDDDTGEASELVNIEVFNAPPVVDAGPDASGVDGEVISFAGAFMDVGTLDTHMIIWDFGDGSPTITGTLNPTHMYGEAGVYLVTLTVIDDDTGVGMDTAMATIANSTRLYHLPIIHNGPAGGLDASQLPWLAWGGGLLALPLAGVIWVRGRRRED